MDSRKRRSGLLSRPISILDLMAIVLACAPAMMIFPDRIQFYSRVVGPPSSQRTAIIALEMGNLALMTATLALTLILVRRPRTGLRSLPRRPGAAACLAASAALLALWARALSKTYTTIQFISGRDIGSRFHLSHAYARLLGGESPIALPVLGAWLMLGLTGTCRAEPSWPDRAGRLVGFGWILLEFFRLTLPWIEPHLPAL